MSKSSAQESFPSGSNAFDVWGLPKIIDFFESHRTTSSDIYKSERHFLMPLLHEGISVLDIGCALGGLAKIISENVDKFTYTGVDISSNMVETARSKFPQHEFLQVPEGDLSILGNRKFDLVLCLGILHLSHIWRKTLEHGWKHTSGHFLFDLRETDSETVVDEKLSYFKMDFNGGGGVYSQLHLPYIVLNRKEAEMDVRRICTGASEISNYGYLHPVTSCAVCPYSNVIMNTWCVKR